jgi:hypothetical protein
MKFKLTKILVVLCLAALAGCSGQDQETIEADAETEATAESGQVVEKPAPKTTEMTPETEAQVAIDENLEKCRAATKKLGGALKSALQEAMGEGGPLAAINVCHDEAEAIATQICDEEGLTVGRTSGKFRNPGNVPDEWEKAGLEAFAARIAAGEKAGDLEMWATVTDAGGNRTFRYLKSIGTGPLCLKCHGSELAPDLEAKLDELYPDDKARGYSVGDLRGAFTVKVDLPRG